MFLKNIAEYENTQLFPKEVFTLKTSWVSPAIVSLATTFLDGLFGEEFLRTFPVLSVRLLVLREQKLTGIWHLQKYFKEKDQYQLQKALMCSGLYQSDNAESKYEIRFLLEDMRSKGAALLVHEYVHYLGLMSGASAHLFLARALECLYLMNSGQELYLSNSGDYSRLDFHLGERAAENILDLTALQDILEQRAGAVSEEDYGAGMQTAGLFAALLKRGFSFQQLAGVISSMFS